jgi:hypothetical protein
MATLIGEAIHRCHLDLRGAVVLTEGATGPYVVTSLLAATAGADRVYALTRATPYGTVEDVESQTDAIAVELGVANRIGVVTSLTDEMIGTADIVTNSGHVRPLDGGLIARMRRGAVIPLMYETWEYRPADLDLHACRERGILVGGTNERHPAIDVFSYLGGMAVKQIVDAGVAVFGTSVLLLCDNPFAPFIERGLTAGGAQVTLTARLDQVHCNTRYDAILCACTPQTIDVLGARDLQLIASRWPGAVLVQYWGDVDRAIAATVGIPCWPPSAPGRGHMAVLPSALGPEPIVRLQTGGLKCGEVMWRTGSASDSEFVQAICADLYELAVPQWLT